MKALILEDENRAADRLKRLIASVAPEIEIIATFESIREAKSYFNSGSQIQLLFSDIQLADGLSFELFADVEISCPVIFTTAYDQYAIKAFKNNGIDYLLKPIVEEELKIAINKFKRMNQSPVMADLMALAAQLNTGKKETRERFMVKVGAKLKSFSVVEISAFYSENKGTYLLTKEGRSYLLDFSIEQLVDMLEKKNFFRINRKYIVRIDAVEEVVVWSNSRLKLHMKGSSDPDIVVARERTKDFKHWLDA